MRSVTLYLAYYHREMVIRKKHQYFNNLIKSLQLHGFRVKVEEVLPDTSYAAGLIEDYAILDKLLLGRENCLTIRRAIYVPYWSVEAGEYRSEFRLFNKAFKPDTVNPLEASEFVQKLRRKQIGVKNPITDLGEAVYIPLQGRLKQKRRGQSMSPFDMIRTVRENEPNREILISQHPGEKYSDSEVEALWALAKELDATISDEPMSVLMRKARYVATMNSTVGFEGMVWGVPVMLFGDADFHHLLTNIRDFENIADAFEAVKAQPRDYDRYLKWYLDDHMISARKEDAITRTLDYFRDFGWDIPKL